MALVGRAEGAEGQPHDVDVVVGVDEERVEGAADLLVALRPGYGVGIGAARPRQDAGAPVDEERGQLAAAGSLH